MDVQTTNPLSVPVRKRAQAVTGEGVPELDSLITGAGEQVVLRVSNRADFVLVACKRLLYMVSLQVPKLDGEIS